MVTVIFVVGPFVTTWLFNLSNTTAHPCYSIIEEEVEKEKNDKKIPADVVEIESSEAENIDSEGKKVVAVEIKVENTKEKKRLKRPICFC